MHELCALSELVMILSFMYTTPGWKAPCCPPLHCCNIASAEFFHTRMLNKKLFTTISCQVITEDIFKLHNPFFHLRVSLVTAGSKCITWCSPSFFYFIPGFQLVRSIFPWQITKIVCFYFKMTVGSSWNFEVMVMILNEYISIACLSCFMWIH